MKLNAKNIALCAMLTALALGLSTLEGLFPITLLFVPLPGVKLGLANIVTVFALYRLGPVPALTVLVLRCMLGSIFAGNMSALLFSLLSITFFSPEPDLSELFTDFFLTTSAVFVLCMLLFTLSIFAFTTNTETSAIRQKHSTSMTAGLSFCFFSCLIFSPP